MGGDCLGRLQSEGPERGPGGTPGGAIVGNDVTILIRSQIFRQSFGMGHASGFPPEGARLLFHKFQKRPNRHEPLLLIRVVGFMDTTWQDKLQRLPLHFSRLRPGD
jgi:hypothetical protein